MDVELLHWPVDNDRLIRLRSAGRARLLVIDIPGRITGLERRMELANHDRPVIDECVLRMGRSWVAIPPVEMRIIHVLAERLGTVVGREILTRAEWPDGISDRNALDVQMMRLRRRIDDIGLAIRTVRGRGYLLEATSSNQQPTSPRMRGRKS